MKLTANHALNLVSSLLFAAVTSAQGNPALQKLDEPGAGSAQVDEDAKLEAAKLRFAHENTKQEPMAADVSTSWPKEAPTKSGFGDASGPQILILDAPDAVRIGGENLGAATHVVLLGSDSPDMRRLEEFGIAALATPTFRIGGPVGDPSVGWIEVEKEKLDGPIFVQLLTLDATGAIHASPVRAVLKDGSPDLGNHDDCDDGRPAYDGPAMDISLETIHWFDGRDPTRAVAVGFDERRNGYTMFHRATVVTECGEDVFLMLEQYLPGDIKGESLPPRHELFELATDHGRVRVLVARAMKTDDGIVWTWQVAAVFAGER